MGGMLFKQITGAVVAALFMAGAVAQPKPTYAAARKFPDAVTNTLGKTMLWDKKPEAERMQAVKAALALAQDAERVFGSDDWGPYRFCLAMARRHVDFVQAINGFARVSGYGDQIKLFNINEGMTVAYHLGELRQNCRDSIEPLDVAPKK